MLTRHMAIPMEGRRSRRPPLLLVGERERRRERITSFSGRYFLSPLANVANQAEARQRR